MEARIYYIKPHPIYEDKYIGVIGVNGIFHETIIGFDKSFIMKMYQLTEEQFNQYLQIHLNNIKNAP